jgi:hypothetical protein
MSARSSADAAAFEHLPEQPQDGDVVVSNHATAGWRYALRQVPCRAQLLCGSRDSAVEIARRFAREHSVNVWLSHNGTSVRLDVFRPETTSAITGTAQDHQ